MTSTTNPLVPPECDLRDFAFMPLDVVRLRDSGLTAKASGDEFRAAVLLWCASWHQVPASSLPNDDDELANICGYSRSRKEWQKIRAGALRGWVLCNDGRMYHPAVAGKALEAWVEKLASSISGMSGNSRRWGVQIDDRSLVAQFQQAVACLKLIAPQSRSLKKKIVAVLARPAEDHIDTDDPLSTDESWCDPSLIPTRSPPDRPPIAPRSLPDRNRQGQGQGQGYIEDGENPPAIAASATTAGAVAAIDPCPHQEIIDLFHRTIPSARRVREWTPARSQALRARWREKPSRQNLGWWERFFRYVSGSDFLMGRTSSPGRKPFDLSLDWLVKSENMAKVIEGAYDNDKTMEVA